MKAIEDKFSELKQDTIELIECVKATAYLDERCDILRLKSYY